MEGRVICFRDLVRYILPEVRKIVGFQLSIKVLKKLIQIYIKLSLTKMFHEGGMFYVTSIGKLRVHRVKPKIFDEEGNLIESKLRMDWGNTIKYYLKQNPGVPYKEMQRRLAVLFREAKAKGEKPFRIYHFNENHNGYYFVLKFTKFPFKYKTKYKFEFLQTLTKKLAANAKNKTIKGYD